MVRGIRLFVFLTLLLPAILPAILVAEPILLDGRAVTAGGQGIAGARVTLQAPLPGTPEGRTVAEVITGVDGRFELTAPGPGLWSVTVRKDGLAPMWQPPLPVFAGTGLLPVEMRETRSSRAPGGGRLSSGAGGWEPDVRSPAPPAAAPGPLSLTGGVIDQVTRRPIPRALVWPADDPGRAVWTDAAGRFRIDGLPARGRLASKLEIRAAAADSFPASQRVVLEEGAPRVPPVLALAPAPAISGTVVDAKNQPLAGAEILLSRRDEADAWAARADTHRARTPSNGTFRLSGLTAGASYDLLVTLPDYAPAVASISMPHQGQSRTGLVLQLRRGRAAGGGIQDAAGRPVEGARVELIRSQSGRTTAGSVPSVAEDGLYKATSGPDGRFALLHLPPGRFDLRIEGEGLAPLERAGLEIPAGRGVLDLGRFVVERGAVLTGRVTDPQGRPVPDAEVWLVPRAPRDWISFYKKGAAAVSGPEGDFVISGLPRRGELGLGELSLDVCRKGFLPATVPVREISAEPIHAELAPAARIAGRVAAPNGEPVAGARILAWLSGEGPQKPPSLRPCRLSDGVGASDAEGRFVLESLTPGWWTVRAEASGWLSAESGRRQVLAGESLEGIEIVLGEGAVVSGRVFSPEGILIAGAEVRAYGNLGNPRAVSAGDGTYRLTGVEIGERSIEATHPDHEFASHELTVSPGDNQLDLKLRPNQKSEIRGRVLGPDGRTVAGARVVLTGGTTSTYSAADGTFSLLERDGTYEVWADKQGYAPGRAAQKATLAGRDVEGIEVRLTAGGVVTGRLLGLDAERLRSARIEITLQPPFKSLATIDPLGGYRIADVPPGEWMLTATAGERTLTEPVALPPGTEELVVDLAFPETWEVTGQILGPYGEPVADALLRLAVGGRGGSGGWTYTRRDGTFRLELEDGTYRAWVVRRSSFQSALEAPVVVEGGPVSGLELRVGAEIVLRGLISGLEPGERAKAVWAEGPRGIIRQGELDQQSGFAVYGLVPGAWTITVLHGERAAVERVEIEEGETEVAVEMVLEAPPPPEADTPEG
jgi:protocatechuate 3,4-dioxygenase beta subunit